MTPSEQKTVCRILLVEFEKLRARNPAFSQRAFAKKLGVHSGTLNALFQGKRTLTWAKAKTMLGRLKLEKHYYEWLMQTLGKKGVKIQRTLLDIDRFEILSDPSHLNALNLLRTNGSERSQDWLARRMRKSSEEIASIVDCLARARLVKVENGVIIPTRNPIRTPDNFPHHAVRSFHKNTLKEAAEKLETVPLEWRDFSSITIPADPSKIEEVRDLVRAFRDQVSFLVGSAPGTEVYKLSVQFYPVASEKEI